jgi:hypothetical protein
MDHCDRGKPITIGLIILLTIAKGTDILYKGPPPLKRFLPRRHSGQLTARVKVSARLLTDITERKNVIIAAFFP